MVRVDGRTVPYRVTGAGPPVVLVHGLAGSWRWWRPCLPALAAAHSVYALDLPGFGDNPGRFSLADAPAFVCGWMAAVGLEAAALVGHSMGAGIVARVAASVPRRVSRLVLVSPAIDLRTSLFAYAVPLARTALTTAPAFAPTLMLDAMRSGLLGLTRATLEVLSTPVTPAELEALPMPTLLVWGALDPMTPPRGAEPLRARIPDARVHLIPQAGHVPMFDAPAEFARAVLDHLDAGAEPVGRAAAGG